MSEVWDFCSPVESSSDIITRLRNELDALTIKSNRYETALKDIVDPKTKIKRELPNLEIDERKLIEFANNPTYLKQIAVAALRDVICSHESDGLMYPTHPPKFRCKKCGKYYMN